eukprot:TRINITY_DN6180_c0_g1_i2.p1 TRINITY_DN6180_c0_g1~~TRINITY_DN6180_c0_g1_i2.p1  ORF type:complete len:268 (-),score=29.39 TRINITY_DN6180_c0_g1_i2:140-943(-)
MEGSARPQLRGWLKKQGDDVLKQWKQRYFVQDDQRLYYYSHQPADGRKRFSLSSSLDRSAPAHLSTSPGAKDKDEKGFIDLSIIKEVKIEANSFQFQITSPGRTYFLRVYNPKPDLNSPKGTKNLSENEKRMLDDLLQYWVDGIRHWAEFYRARPRTQSLNDPSAFQAAHVSPVLKQPQEILMEPPLESQNAGDAAEFEARKRSKAVSQNPESTPNQSESTEVRKRSKVVSRTVLAEGEMKPPQQEARGILSHLAPFLGGFFGVFLP